MHRNRHSEQQIHQRIIGRLLGLALLCEKAAGSSLPLRFMFLWLLRTGLVVAHNYAQDLALDAGYQLHLPCSSFPWQGCGSEDALRLAQHFRALADVLDFLSDWVVDETRQPNVGHATIKRRHVQESNLDSLLQMFRGPAHFAQSAPDTS